MKAKIECLFQFEPGKCEQAIELYKKAFGAEIKMLVRFSEADPKDFKAEEKDKILIYHAQIMIGKTRILMCDNLFNKLPRGNTVYPVVMLKTPEDVKAVYEVLKDGATITNPIGATTYCPCGVSLVDKFGIFWDLMTEWK